LLEENLVDRVALQLWRLRRVARYERETLALLQGDTATPVHRPRPAPDRAAVDLENAQVDLREARSAARLIAAFPSMAEDATVSGQELWRLAFVLRVAAGEGAELETLPDPADGELVYLDEIAGDENRWPIRVLRDALPQLAGAISIEELQGRARAAAEKWRVKATTAHDDAREAFEERRRAIAEERRPVEQARREHILPDEHEREQISRYETTIERSLFRTLAELRQLQAARVGEPTVVVVPGDGSAGSRRS